MKTLLLGLFLAVLPSLALAGPGEGDDVYTYEYNLPPGTPGDLTRIKNTVLEMAIDGDVNPDAIKKVIGDQPVDAATILEFEEPTANPRGFRVRAKNMLRGARAKVSQVVRTSAAKFEEWAANPRAKFPTRRITLFLIEVGTIFGTQYKELVAAPVPFLVAPAITASLLITAMVGALEWHILPVNNLILKVESPVKWLFNKISKGAAKINLLLSSRNSREAKTAPIELENGEITTRLDQIQIKYRGRLDFFYMFQKMVKLNWILLGAMKLILYSVAQHDGSVIERVGEAFAMMSKAELAEISVSAYAATVLSFPTSYAIKQYGSRLENDAVRKLGVEATKDLPLEVKQRLGSIKRAYFSSALMFRALMICSFAIGVAAKSPVVAATSMTALVGFSAVSLWEYFKQAKRAAKEALGCEMAYNPALDIEGLERPLTAEPETTTP